MVTVGLVPSVCMAPVGKSGSVIIISSVAGPAGISTSQFPFASVETTDTTPWLSVI